MNIQERWLLLLFSPLKKISEVPVLKIQQELISIFKTWGVPKGIKVDNGRPFGDPQLQLVPPLALWLIALGIKVTWNRPAKPQDNAKVERSQGVLGKWTEYSKCEDTFELQRRLWKEADFHNRYFPLRRKGGKTRLELFPRLAHTGRDWEPTNFQLQRVLTFLSQAVWERKISSCGQLRIYGQRFTVGLPYRHQEVNVKLDPLQNQWNIFDAKGTLIKTKASPFSEQSIWNIDFS